MTDCPGACNAAVRATGQGDPQPGEPVWCRWDAARIRTQLAALDTLIPLLEHGADGYGEATDHPGSNGRAAHAPSPSPSGDHILELEETLREWEHVYRRVKGWPSAERHGYQAQVTTEIITWLSRHLDGILESPFAVEFGQEVTRAHREFTAMAKAGHGYRRGMVPCPRCQLRLLGGRIGDPYLVCGNCNRYVSDDEYTDLVKQATRAAS